MGVTISVIHNRLGEMQSKLPGAVELAVDKFLGDVHAYAGARTPRRTGYLANSVSRGAMWIAWGALYAAYVNFGTRYMAARPFATDAFNRAIPGLMAALADLESFL